jgi:pectate lyase
MKLKSKLFAAAIIFAAVLVIPTQVKAIPAFPGAEGFGAETVGGRGGRIYEVTNLNDTGSGSLRECVQASGARICIFKIGGSITLASDLNISNPFITIAGQTAPGGGILLRKNGGTGDLIHIATHDVVIRYLTLRRGPPSNISDVNGMSIYKNNSSDIYNIVIDHCSMSWTNDRILFSWYGPRNLSIQWSLFTEPFHCNKNSKGCPYSAKSVMLGSGVIGEGSSTPGAKEISFHHNLITHGDERNPLVKPAGIAEIISNVTYNTSATYAHMDADLQPGDFPVNFIGNYFRAGPSGSSEYGIKMSLTGKKAIVYLKGNIDSHRHNSSQAENLVMSTKHSEAFTLTDTKNPSDPPYPVTISTCDSDPATGGQCDTYNKVVVEGLAGNNRGVDSNGNWYFRRDAVDKRILEEVKNKGGKVIDAPGINTCWASAPETCKYLTLADYTKYGISSNEIDFSDNWFNGWPVITNGTAYIDSDHDGMSDSWETAQGLNPNSNDSAADKDGDGYTNIEEFLNGNNTPSVTSTSTPIPTLSPNPTITRLPGDINTDRVVNLLDYTMLSNAFGTNNTAADLNTDHTVDLLDFTLLNNNFGKSI